MELMKLSLLGCLMMVALSANGASLSVANQGFEDLYLGSDLPDEYGGVVPATAFPSGPAPAGWTPYGASGHADAFLGVLNPGSVFFLPGQFEGNNVALAYFGNYLGGAEFGIEQTLGDTLQLNTTYTLQVDIGNIASGTSTVAPYLNQGLFNLAGFPGYRVELLAGTTLIAMDNDSLNPAEGEFQTSTIQATIGSSHTAQGQDLTIRLISLNLLDVNDPAVTGIEVDFDDVRLDAVAVPLPPAFALLLPALLALVTLRRGAVTQ
jgi:hypothetical protein